MSSIATTAAVPARCAAANAASSSCATCCARARSPVASFRAIRCETATTNGAPPLAAPRSSRICATIATWFDALPVGAPSESSCLKLTVVSSSTATASVRQKSAQPSSRSALKRRHGESGFAFHVPS